MTAIISEAVKVFGADNQKIVAIEELAELQKEISKDLRGELHREHLIEELADVMIMLEQVMHMNAIKEYEVKNVRAFKLLRLEKRIEMEKILKGLDV